MFTGLRVMATRLFIIRLLFVLSSANLMILCYLFCDPQEGKNSQLGSYRRGRPPSRQNITEEAFLHALHDFNSRHSKTRTLTNFTVAIGCAITSRDVPLWMLQDLTIYKGLVFFKSLLPSFCATASGGYRYAFYLGYDHDDAFFNRTTNLNIFLATFQDITTSMCRGLALELHFVAGNYSRRPAWSQNDAMIEAYQNGAEYFYRINDDTIMASSNWTDKFITALESFDPPNVGVVGPMHRGGLQNILTYDFVHRTHIDIFGCYYPRVFLDWYGDTWISDVYKPGRIAKLRDVKLVHTIELKRRYKVNTDIHHLTTQITRSKGILIR